MKCVTCKRTLKVDRAVKKTEYHVVIQENGKRLVWHLECFLIYRLRFNTLLNL